jgi:hypothetical protein
MRTLLPLVLAIATSSASVADWPQFHGANRDNKSPDTGLLKTWPEGGPSRIREVDGLGEGYSTVAIVGKRVYTTGAIEEDCVITALNMEEHTVWTQKNGKAWAGYDPDGKSVPTPEVSDN